MTTLPISPARTSMPVFPDGDGCFDRTAAPSPVGPLETLQQCGVSRVVQIELSPLLDLRALIDMLEQAAALGYNQLQLTGNEPFVYDGLEQLLSTTRSLGYRNSAITGGAQLQTTRAQRILKYLHHVGIKVDGKQEAHDRIHRRAGAFSAMLSNLAILRDKTEKFGIRHNLGPSSWQILSWLTDFALKQKASDLHLYYQEPSHAMHHQICPTRQPFSPTDLYRIFIAHYYLKTFSEPDLHIRVDLIHRDRLECPHFLKKLVITETGDLFPIAGSCSSYFHIGHLHSNSPLLNMLDRFLKKRGKAITQLYNETYRDILNAGAGSDIVNWTVKLIENSYSFQSVL